MIEEILKNFFLGVEYFTCTVFVGDISPHAQEFHLEEAFRSYGQILSARIINDKPYGFVKFKYEEDTRRAIAEMNGHLLCGLVNFFRNYYCN